MSSIRWNHHTEEADKEVTGGTRETEAIGESQVTPGAAVGNPKVADKDLVTLSATRRKGRVHHQKEASSF